MSAIKEWGMDMVYELNKEGYSRDEIISILECDPEFVDTILGEA